MNMKLNEYVTGPPLMLLSFMDIAILLAELVYREHQHISMIGNINPNNIVIKGASAHLVAQMEWDKAYHAPEQSGRMNRIADARCDLYALGVIYYELLTGRLPVLPPQDGDWENAHIWQSPRPLSELRSDTEGPLQDIIIKLLAKSPDERYQSAYGLLDDLINCRRRLTSEDELPPFRIGSLDERRVFRTPAALFGREDAMSQLTEGAEQAGKGGLAFRWITGREGSGKTTLVQQLRLLITHQEGRYIEGTVAADQSSSPYKPLLQALDQWLKQQWSESPEHMQLLKNKLQMEFGDAADLIVSLLPAARPLFVLEKDGPSSEREPQEIAQLLSRLICCFATSSPPLLLYIDHLEYAADSLYAVFEMLEEMQDASGIFIVGACRTSEEGNSEQAQAVANTSLWLKNRLLSHSSEEIALAPLGYEEVRQYVSAALHDSSLRVRLLARAVFDQTGGMPRAIVQLLEGWVRSRQLYFDDQQRRWVWDEAAVGLLSHHGVDIQPMEQSFAALSVEAKSLLAAAAVIGNSFDRELLTEVIGCRPEYAIRLLHAAEAQGIVGRGDEQLDERLKAGPPGKTYMFLHNYLYQLAYDHDQEQNRHRHRLVGRQLLLSHQSEDGDAQLSAAVDQLNRGSDVMPQHELEELIAYNLQLGSKAVHEGQYRKGKYYAETGLRLIKPLDPVNGDKVFFHLKLNLAMSLFMNGNLEQSREMLLELMQYSQHLSRKEQLLIWQPLIQYHTFTDNKTAIQYGSEALEIYGWKPKENPSLLVIMKEVALTQLLLYRKRGKVQLVTSEQDEDYVELCSLILQLSFSLLLHDAGSLIELYARFIRYGISKGINELLATIIVTYELLLQRVLPGYKQPGYFANSAMIMTDGISHFTYRHHFAYLSGLSKQLEHPAEADAYLKQALQRGIKHGDKAFVNMAIITCLITDNGDLYTLGGLLDSLAPDIRHYGADKTVEIVGVTERTLAALRDASLQQSFIAIPEPATDAADQLEEDNYSCCCRLKVAYLSGNYVEALYWARLARGNELASDWASVRRHRFFEAMTLAAMYPEADEGRRRLIRKALLKQLKRMKKWKGIFGLHSAAHRLIKAEWARIAGKASKVVDSYWAAVKQARSEKNGLIEGMSCERLALYYEQQLMSRAGAMIAMMDACTAYSIWGITSKVTQIRNDHAELLQVLPEPYEGQQVLLGGMQQQKSLLGNPHNAAKAATAASDEFDQLLGQINKRGGVKQGNWLESFLEAALHQTGADWGVVLVCKEGEYTAQAQSYSILSSEQKQWYGHSVLRHTAITNEPVVLYDAQQSYFVKDEYIALQRTRSILCMPIVIPGEPFPFILYLENRQVPGVFTKRDLDILELILARTIYLKMLEDEATTYQSAPIASADHNQVPTTEHIEQAELIEPLTAREIEVLIAMSQGLSNKDIGERFDIAESTVKTHTTRIYGKLGVKRRGQAVARAKEWNIID